LKTRWQWQKFVAVVVVAKILGIKVETVEVLQYGNCPSQIGNILAIKMRK